MGERRGIRIRALCNDDCDKLGGLIVRLAQNENWKSVLEMIVPTNEKIQKAENVADQVESILPLAQKVLSALLSNFKEDFRAFLFDLVEDKPESYGKLPFGADVIIISQILESKEFADFFSGASLVYKGVVEYAKRLLPKKTK